MNKIERYKERYKADGTYYYCPVGHWEGQDFDVPEDCWTTEDMFDGYYYVPLCPLCRQDLWVKQR